MNNLPNINKNTKLTDLSKLYLKSKCIQNIRKNGKVSKYYA